jgi:hypothetical protein
MGEIRMVDGDLERRDRIARWLMERDEVGMVFTPSDDPVQGAVEGTFSLAAVGLDHARQPELVYVLRSGTERDAHGLPGLGLITGGVPVGGGMHGGLNRHELNTVLVLGGAARTGAASVTDSPAGIVDIAPTVLDLLGLAMPAAMKGASLMDPQLRRASPVHEVFDAGTGAFRQQLTIARRGGHCFPIHGGRVG